MPFSIGIERWNTKQKSLVAALVGAVIVLGVSLLVRPSFGMIIVSCMVITILAPLIGPAFYGERDAKFHRWLRRSTIDFRTTVSINGTMITGALIFLTVSNLAGDITFTGLFDPNRLFTVDPTPLMSALAALIIIPFAFSSILILLWGGEEVGGEPEKHRHKIGNPSYDKETGEPVYTNNSNPKNQSEEQERPELEPGVKMGVIYMITGFLWIITSMIILLIVSGTQPLDAFDPDDTSDPPAFPSLPTTILVNADHRNGVSSVNYTNPVAVDSQDRIINNNTVTCVPPSGSPFPLNETIVTCTAVDSDGNIGIETFTVRVVDTPPDTNITGATVDEGNLVEGARTFSKNITFAFTGDDNVGVARFECKMYSAVSGADVEFLPCKSPQHYHSISTAGIHTFEVRAIDVNNQIDEDPAEFNWEIMNLR